MGIVKAVCTSDKKGIPKTAVESIELIENFGVKGDAHAGNWHRQVSLLSWDIREDFRKKYEEASGKPGDTITDGAFGENLLVEGYDFKSLPVGTVFTCGDVVLEMTQIGKECHKGCIIQHTVGDCIMPREGVFAIVKSGGTIKPGDVLEIKE